jgi:hypothetical protein
MHHEVPMSWRAMLVLLACVTVGATSSADPPGADPGQGACHDTTACVKLETKLPTGPGHCTNELVGWFTNNCSTRAYCTYAPVKNGKRGSGGGTAVGQGKRVGGELGGIWFCDQGDSLTYRCVDDADPDSCKHL